MNGNHSGYKLKGLGAWQLLLFCMVISEALALTVNCLLSLLWWGHVSGELIAFTAIGLFIVTLAVALLIIFKVQRTDSNRAMFQRLQEEVARRKEQERQLATIIAHTPDIIYRVDDQGRLTFVSQAVSQLGVSPDELIGRPVWDLVHPDDREEAQRALEVARRGQELPGGLDVRLLRIQDGEPEPRFFEISIEGVYSGEPKGPKTLQGALGVARDVTELKRAQIARQRSEEDFRLLFESSPEGIAVAKRDTGSFLYVNPALCHMLGYPPNQCQGLSVDDIHPPRDLPRVQTVFNRMAAGELTTARELPCLRKDGQVFYADVHGSPASGFGGGVVIGFFRDVTERVLAERKLRDGEAKFRMFTDHVSVDGLIIHHRGRILEVSEPFARMHGYLQEEMIGMDALRLIAPQDRALVSGKLVSSEESVYHVTDLRKDGTMFPVEIRVTTLFYQGRQVRAAAVRDISDRVQAERSLRDAEERYRTLFQRAGDAILLMEAEGPRAGAIVEANLAAATMHGLEPGEIQGKPVAELTTPETNVRVTGLVPRMLAGEWFNLEGMHVRRDGSSFPVEISVGCIQLGDRKFILGIDRDVSQRKEAEAQRASLERQLRQTQRLEALGTLAGGIAHDFNNILGAVLGHAELAGVMVERGENPSRSLAGVGAACRRARDLIARILAFSRGGEEEFQPVEVRQVVEEALNILRAGLPPGVALEPRLEDEAVVLGDVSQIHQVVLNLCTNAGQAMAEKGGVITVSLRRTEPDQDLAAELDLPAGELLELAVADNGPGMTAQTVERIFDPFFTTKRPLEGTGLGLSVVHGIVQKMGGQVHCQSAPGRGAEFRVWLPLMAGGVAARSESALPTEKAGSERLLLVDDEVDLARLSGELLGYLGYQVALAHSGDEAWRVFSQNPDDYDVVITDHYMPGMSGRELARRLRGLRPELPVILCSGGAAGRGPGRMEGAEVDRVLAKPVAISEMAAAVRDVLDGRGRQSSSPLPVMECR